MEKEILQQNPEEIQINFHCNIYKNSQSQPTHKLRQFIRLQPVLALDSCYHQAMIQFREHVQGKKNISWRSMGKTSNLWFYREDFFYNNCIFNIPIKCTLTVEYIYSTVNVHLIGILNIQLLYKKKLLYIYSTVNVHLIGILNIQLLYKKKASR